MIKIIAPAILMLIMALSAQAYNVVDLPQEMTLSDAMGIFNAEEITRVTVSHVAEEQYIELTREEILDFYYTAQGLNVSRTINPTPFRGVAVNVYTENDVKSYYLNSGIQIGLYGSGNYVCYKMSDTDTEKILYLQSKYKDAEQKLSGRELYRNTANDFLKLPSAPWAQSFAKEAAAASLLPYEFTGRYSENITREQFCILLGNFITVKEGYVSLSMFMFDRGQPYLRNYFEDCNGVDDSVNILHALGIVNGRDETHFDPHGTITREEAATLLCKVAEMYIPITTKTGLKYKDTSSISLWARYFVTWATENGVMTGITEDEFVPQGQYTVEQAVATVVRLNKLLK